MASEAILKQKEAAVAQIADELKNACAGVVVSYSGITVADDTKLRRDLRNAGVKYTVVKNTLLSRAAEQAGLDGLKDVLSGSTALATSESDPVVAAKILCEFADKSKTFEIKSGFVDGQVVDADKVKALAKLPNREGMLTGLVFALTGAIRNFLYAINAVVDKKNGEAA